MSTGDTLGRLSKEYKEQMPEDLRKSHSYRWYLNEVVENPEIARSAHQRLADMFDYYGS